MRSHTAESMSGIKVVSIWYIVLKAWVFRPPGSSKCCPAGPEWLMLQMVPADELNASIAYSEEWKALEDHVSTIEKM